MNIKKVMHKDRHGAQVSVEFDPSGAANPQALGVLQEFFKVAVPQMGGVPEQHPGQPKGTDTVPAWLTPGEFVMNAEATRMFEPQIKQMNEAGRAVQAAQGGTVPEYKADGGPVYLAGGSNNFISSLIPLDKWGNFDFQAYQNANLVSPVEDAAIEAYKAGASPADIYKLSGVNVGNTNVPYHPTDVAKAADDAFGSGGPWGAIAQAGYLDPPEFIGDAVEGAIDGYNWLKDKGTKLGGWLADTDKDLTDKFKGMRDDIHSAIPDNLLLGKYGQDAIDAAKGLHEDWSNWTKQKKEAYLEKVKSGEIKDTSPYTPVSINDMTSVPPMSQPEIEAQMMEEEALARSARPMPQAEIDARRKEVRERYAEGKITKREYDTEMLVMDYTQPQEKVDTIKKEQTIAELLNKQKRANEIGDTELASKYGAEIDKLQGEVDAYNKKPTKPTEPTNKLKIDGVEVTEKNLDSFTPKLTQAGAEAAKDPGVFKSAMNWVDENFGGILNSDDLKKMVLYYLGSRAFGNSHEGSANWVGTMFVKDSEKRQALYDKLALSGKYTEKSLAKFKKTNDMTDLVGVTTTEIDDTPVYYDIKVDGKNVTKQLRKVKYTQNGKTVTKYLDSDDKLYDLKENSIIKTSDREARINSIANNVKTAWDGGLDQVIPLGSLTGDKRAAAEAERAKLPKGDVVALKVAEFLQDSETHPTNAKVSTMTIALQGEMFDWVKQQKEAGVENPVLSAELIPAMLAKSQVRKIDGVGSLVGNTDFMIQTEVANRLISSFPDVSAEMAVSKGFSQLKKNWDIDSKKPEVMSAIESKAKALSEESGSVITPFMLYSKIQLKML